MIELRAVTVTIAGKTLLSIPTLSFEAGVRYGIIGENGSGKTTLLRILAGTLLPITGSIHGINRQTIRYLPQAPYAFNLSVRRNVAMALPGLENAQELVDRALRRVGMEALAEKRGNRLSGGEAQRMSLARVLLTPCEVLLLDEPTSATDIRGMDQVEQVLKDYIQETGCTLIFSTHSPAQALRLADRVVYLEQGQVVETGPAEQVLHHPRDDRTCNFLRHWQFDVNNHQV